MHLLCSNQLYELYEDGDTFVMQNKKTKESSNTKKSDNPLFPVACCIKWGFTPDDKECIDDMMKEGLKQHGFSD